jgi:hypothetical protein
VDDGDAVEQPVHELVHPVHVAQPQLHGVHHILPIASCKLATCVSVHVFASFSHRRKGCAHLPVQLLHQCFVRRCRHLLSSHVRCLLLQWCDATSSPCRSILCRHTWPARGERVF